MSTVAGLLAVGKLREIQQASRGNSNWWNSNRVQE